MKCNFCNNLYRKHLITYDNQVYICDKCVADAVALVAQLYRKEREQFKQPLKLKKAGE